MCEQNKTKETITVAQLVKGHFNAEVPKHVRAFWDSMCKNHWDDKFIQSMDAKKYVSKMSMRYVRLRAVVRIYDNSRSV